MLKPVHKPVICLITLCFVLTLTTLMACSEDPPLTEPANKTVTEAPPGERFTVTSYGTFQAGFRGNDREILIIIDKETGRQYLGVTGVGVTELHTETRTTGKVKSTTTQEE